jgi:pyruvate formate-lyase/glycerol dehydratase family glycyl radical enzyme
MNWKYWGEPFAKTFMKMEGQHQALRIALGIKSAVEMLDVTLKPEEVIIGDPIKRSIVGYSFGAGISVDSGLAHECIKEEKDESIVREIEEILKYFEGHNTIQKIRDSQTEEEKKCGGMRVFWAGEWGGHTLLDYKLLLQQGTTGLKCIVTERMKTAVEKVEVDWLNSLIIICEALELFAEKYADKAKEMQSLAQSEEEIIALEEIENLCRRVPRLPAASWREALQSFWFAFIFDGVDSPGRFDQYMYPYLKASLDNKEISKEEAQILLEKLWLCFEAVRAWNLCVGGQTVEGQDAANELSYMILDTAKKYKFEAPNLTMRCHKGTPEMLWDKALEVINTGIGMPALYNDEVVIPALQRFGIPLEDARDYAMNGCNQIDIQGKSYMGLEDGELNLLKCLELALNRGNCRLTGEKLGPDTGDPVYFESFEQVMEAYKTQVNYFTKMLTDVANKSQRVYAEHGLNPFRSLLVSDCIKNARDFRAGGPRYNHGQVLTEGIANTADSLAAIKKFVFDEKLLSMNSLLEALNKNFEGFEGLRRNLQTKGSFYGNDEEKADSIAAEVVNHFFSELMKYKTYRGGIYGGGCSTFTRCPVFGKFVAATPDGRLSMTSVADSAGASQGKDKKGPTALLNSAAKVDLSLALSGYVVNIKFQKSMFDSKDTYVKLKFLFKTYFKNGGQQLQINVLDAEELKKAKEDPEKYKSLVVRVGGFSAYFVDLDKELQEDIIIRTSHGA